MGERVELAEEALSVFLGRSRQVGYEGLDRFTAGVTEGLSAAELSGICLNKIGIEVVLADQKAETITEPRLTIVRAVRRVSPFRFRGKGGGLRRTRQPSELFDRAEADAIGFPQCAVNGTSFGDTHLGTTDEWRDVRRIGIPVAHKTSGRPRFVDYGSKNPAVSNRIRLSLLQNRPNP
jgi:hypothetical protein